MAEDAYIRALREAALPKFVTAPFRAIQNTGMGVFSGLSDLGGYAVDNMLGLKSDDPWAGTKERFKNVRGALQDISAPGQAIGESALEARDSAAGLVTDYLESLQKQRLAKGSKPQAATAEPIRYEDTELRRFINGMPKTADAPKTVAQMAAPTIAGRSSQQVLPAVAAPAAQPALMGDGSSMAGAPMALSLNKRVPEEAGALPSVTNAPTAQAQHSLAEEFRNRTAALKTEKGDLTEADKHKLRMDFFLGLLANNQPGSRFLQNVGKSGQAVSAEYSKMSKEAEAAVDRKYGREVDKIFREMGFADKDADNARMDRKNLADERRWDKRDIRETAQWNALNEREKQKLDFELKKFEREGGKPTAHAIGENGNFVLFMPNGTIKETTTKAKAPASDADPIDRGIASLRRIFPQETTEQLFQRYMGTKRDTAKGELSDDELIREANKVVAGSMGAVNLSDAIASLRAERDKLKSGGPKANALPAGLPPGSELVGTSGGKRVFKKPDGSRVIEK